MTIDHYTQLTEMSTQPTNTHTLTRSHVTASKLLTSEADCHTSLTTRCTRSNAADAAVEKKTPTEDV